MHHLKDMICFLFVMHTHILPIPLPCTQICCHCRFPLAFKCLSSPTFHLPLYFTVTNKTSQYSRKEKSVRFLHSIIARKTSIKHGMRRKDYCFYYWPPCQLWSVVIGLIRECCHCRLRSCGGCPHRPHIQLPQHSSSACWVPCNAWEKQPL